MQKLVVKLNLKTVPKLENVLKSIYKVLLLSIVFTFVSLTRVNAQIDPRVKALGAMALYGTIGGALLGTASLAFGSEGRSVAKGASLGLYAGIAFGSYVVISHAYAKHQRENPKAQDNYYPGVKSPYEKINNQEGGYGEDANGEEGYFWNPHRELSDQALRETEHRLNTQISASKKAPISFFLPILNVSF